MYLTIIFLAILILPIPIIAKSMGKRITPFRAVMEGTIAGIIGAVFVLILASATGNGVFETIQESIKAMAPILAKDPNLIQIIGKETTEPERIKFLTELYGQAALLFPSSICILTAVIAYIEYILLSKIIKPAGVAPIPMTKFKNFDLPRNVVVGWLILFALSWIITKTGLMQGDSVYVNINAVFNFVFCLQGISVIFMYCYKKHAPKALAVIIIIFFMISGFGKLVLMILGFSDVIFRLKEKLR